MTFSHDRIPRLRRRFRRRCAWPGRDANEYDARITGYEREIRRLESLKFQVVAAADEARVADRTGLADTSSWLARRTQTGAGRASQGVWLATALTNRSSTIDPTAPRPCADALAQGAVSTAHAQVIMQATDQLPASLSPAAVETVERDLVVKAGRLAPDQLRRAARRALAAVESDQAILDAHEDGLLRSEEDSALARTRLSLHDNGDGTTSGHFTVTTVAAAILARAIQSMTAPRRARLGAAVAQAGDPLERRDWAHQSGLALVELLEHHPRKRM